ncbi:nuclear transport factor 2 family protein [Nocardia sp. CC227C]|uniref:nuclear transport factor 2 family protein n=1 Tax=Nocardia sp. CC227C TaxID=3044562 RepID=UPI00278BE5DD|nr:nuclear transport factor 2 family protein [Nocardia sp. CC227C]
MNLTTAATPELYLEIQQFFARQMRMLDGRNLTGYAETFTEDAIFRHSPNRAPAHTRAGILRDLEEIHAQLTKEPQQRRHMFTMIDIEPRTDGTVAATSYALIVTTRPGGRPDMVRSCVVNDVLVRQDGRLLTRSRLVDHDGVE